MLARCIEASSTDFEQAFRLYEANRQARTMRIQGTSHTNTWLAEKGDADWVYGYDVFAVPLITPVAVSSQRRST
jgi:6-hydroxynicotinate 3-monooxygenase